jgi:hypothetical protein
MSEPDETQTLFSKEGDMPASTAVAHREEGGSAVVAQPEIGSVMSIIGRMASDPAMDIDKFARLLEFQEREVARQAEQAFNAAMSAAQAEMEPVRKDAKSDKGKYASYDALDQAIRPIYTKHGFGLSFDTGDAPKADDIRLLCYVTHEAGGSRTYRLDMPADGKGAKGGDVMTRTHATGSAATYGQRYLLKMVFNIAVSTDDNGNAAGARAASGAFQTAVATVNGLATLADLKAWKAQHAAGLEKLLSANEWTELVRLVNRRVRAMKEGASA